MQIYHIHESLTLQDIARCTGREATSVANANGIPRHTCLDAGTKIIIPSPNGCRPEGCAQILVCGKADAEKQGVALKNASDVSLLLYRSRGRRIPVAHPFIPTFFSSDSPPANNADITIPTLFKKGYIGICLPYDKHSHMITEAEIAVLRNSNLLLAVSALGENLLNNNIPDEITEQADILFVLPPSDFSLEEFLSELSLACPHTVRRKILIEFAEQDGAPKIKNGAHTRRRFKNDSDNRTLEDCHLGLLRLIHDGYGGVVTPVGGTSPALYHMVTSLGGVIPASQRNGLHSRL